MTTRARAGAAGVIVGVSVLSLVARVIEPVQMGASGVDGGLFVRLATFLSHRRWLGPFDALTLAKGPSYPALMALSFRIGVPLKIAEQLTYLLAAACLAGCIWQVTRRWRPAVAAYAVLALNPMSFGVANTSVLRDGWAASLALLFIASTFLAVHAAVTHTRVAWLIAFGLLAGLSGAAFWLCREEGPSIIPSIATIVVGLPVLRWWSAEPQLRKDVRQWLRPVARYAAVLVALGVTLYLPIAFVASHNKTHYRAALTNDMTSGEFARAYTTWMRVEAGPVIRDVPISAAQRQAVYGVSPAARILEPYLENSTNIWMRMSCIHDGPCNLQGAFTVWALRAAASSAGEMTSEPRAQQFFGSLARQIDDACAHRTLRCRTGLPASLQRFVLVTPGGMLGQIADQLGHALWPTGYVALPTTAPTPLSRALRTETHAIVPAVPATQQRAIAQVATFKRYSWPYRLLGFAYTLLLPALLVVSLTVALMRVTRSRRVPGALFVLSLALLVGVAVRLVLLAVVGLVEFDTTQPRYGLPVPLFLLAVGVASVFPRLRRNGSVLVADLGETHREAEHDQLDAADDKDHAGDGDAH